MDAIKSRWVTGNSSWYCVVKEATKRLASSDQRTAGQCEPVVRLAQRQRREFHFTAETDCQFASHLQAGVTNTQSPESPHAWGWGENAMDNERWEIGKMKLNNQSHGETRSKIINETKMKTSAKSETICPSSGEVSRTSPLNCKSHFACYQRHDVCLSALSLIRPQNGQLDLHILTWHTIWRSHYSTCYSSQSGNICISLSTVSRLLKETSLPHFRPEWQF